ncbi:hypothetical protein Ancab_015815 [Ancistrocladus abbreviatus]
MRAVTDMAVAPVCYFVRDVKAGLLSGQVRFRHFYQLALIDDQLSMWEAGGRKLLLIGIIAGVLLLPRCLPAFFFDVVNRSWPLPRVKGIWMTLGMSGLYMGSRLVHLDAGRAIFLAP